VFLIGNFRLKVIGLNKAQVARKLELDVKTVSKYWDADPDTFHEIRQAGRGRSRKLKNYRDVILKWLREHPDMSAAQVLDWLKEYYDDFSVRERTLRRYIDELRKKNHLPKPVQSRQYQAVPELPPGKQVQVDFGQTRARNTGGGYTTLYVMGIVLAHCRYKYGQWSDKPFTTAMFVQMLLICFEHLGGVPEEIVIDQDKLATISENYGDIIFLMSLRNLNRPWVSVFTYAAKVILKARVKLKRWLNILKGILPLTVCMQTSGPGTNHLMTG